MNQFGDLTVDEFRFYYLGLRSHYSNETKRQGSAYLPPSGVSLPPTVDWRTKGYVTPVKNQGKFDRVFFFKLAPSTFYLKAKFLVTSRIFCLLTDLWKSSWCPFLFHLASFARLTSSLNVTIIWFFIHEEKQQTKIQPFLAILESVANSWKWGTLNLSNFLQKKKNVCTSAIGAYSFN